jgi:acyl dehydratase
MQTGITFEGFHPGDRFMTGRRTITETDIIQFVCLVGMFEPLFIDAEYIREESLYGQRIAPGSLTFSMAEGLTVQTGILHTTGMAFVGLEQMKLLAPVKLGDTIHVQVEVLDRKEVKRRRGGIVRFRHQVRNQRGETVMEYQVSRLIRGAQRKSDRRSGRKS